MFLINGTVFPFIISHECKTFFLHSQWNCHAYHHRPSKLQGIIFLWNIFICHAMKMPVAMKKVCPFLQDFQRQSQGGLLTLAFPGSVHWQVGKRRFPLRPSKVMTCGRRGNNNSDTRATPAMWPHVKICIEGWKHGIRSNPRMPANVNQLLEHPMTAPFFKW